jgi:hypothetical protein
MTKRRQSLEGTASITIMDAVTDPDIFGGWFRDRQSWAAWLCFLKCFFGLPLEDAELEIFRRCTGRDNPAEPGYFLATLVVGRRGGKSLIMALIAAYLRCFFDWSPFLTVNEKAHVVIVAADRRQASVIFKYLRGMIGIPLLAGMIERETLDTLELNNGVVIEIQTASWKTIRGRTVVVALCDEAAFRSDENSANPDSEIINALKPAMATIPMARMLIASSPYARKGVLWNDYDKHFGRNDSSTLVWQADTGTMNPSVPADFIAAAYEDDASASAAEYGAQFRTDVEMLFSREAIRAVTVPTRLELPPVSGVSFSAFTDPSGGSADSMTLAISHMEGDLAVLDCVREVKPPFSPEAVVEDFCALLKSYGISEVCGDRYAGQWPREQFSKRGIYYRTSEKTASDLFIEFLPMVNAGRVQLLDHKRGLAQLVALERRTSRTGKDTVSHPPTASAHDDVAVAIAGALVTSDQDSMFQSNSWNPWAYDEADLSPDQNFRAAQLAFETGHLTGRDLRWFKAEQQRRAKQVSR